ncbi:MAG: DUF4380 domain-containing protein [Thermoguttaceae bacterium]|jgi:hypothetical protein|nr:DUF4380 domain-containing protein [Thermoguttaceae bacterium]
MEKVAYGGWPNCIRMSNGVVELIATTDVGPRIIRFGFVGKENEFYEDPEQLGKTNADEWLAFGGHRLWLAPEAKPRSYFPDSRPVKVVQAGGALRLIQPIETTNGIEKEIEVTLDPASAHVTVIHKLTNHNLWDTELAPWCLTVMAPKGKAIFPQEPYSPHPDIPDTPGQVIDKRFYLPVRTLVLWSYTNLQDPRWVFTSKYLVLKQDPEAKKPLKIGMSNEQEWGAYLRAGHLFVKRVKYQKGAIYPDHGCNFETFTNPAMLELESLGPMVKLPPGGSVTHREDWYLFDGVTAEDTDAAIDAAVLPKVRSAMK